MRRSKLSRAHHSTDVLTYRESSSNKFSDMRFTFR